HGPYEYASIDVMMVSVQVIIGIVEKVTTLDNDVK
ncbi:hypothetical protein, partial [Staphylococcus felis]